jgi:Raf kinase inhibitor-like YbhB/YbcL family protein
MARIRIDDLPVAENLTPEQEALIQGAGPKFFRPSLEVLEGRDLPALIGPGIDLTDTVLKISASNTSQNYGAQVWMNDANQVVAQRNTGPAVFLDQSQVTRIVYLGGEGRDTFRNNTSIPSSFPNLAPEQGDVHTSGLNSARPPSTLTGFNLTSTFTDGRLPDSSAVSGVKRNGQLIGAKNEAPPLAWQGAPPATQSFAVVMKDISVPESISPSKTWHHQILYNIPKGTQNLDFSKALPGDTGLPYPGPNPPDGQPHTYVYTVYALKTDQLQLAGMTPQQMEDAIKAQSIGQTSLSATFSADINPDWDTSTNAWKP